MCVCVRACAGLNVFMSGLARRDSDGGCEVRRKGVLVFVLALLHVALISFVNA